MELETKVTQYEEEIKEKKSGKEKSKETLPRGPPRHILKGKYYCQAISGYLHDVSSIRPFSLFILIITRQIAVFYLR